MADLAFAQALAARARSVVFLSSMSVYGAVDRDVVDEETPPRALDPYGRAKRDAEAVLEDCIARGLGSALAIRLPGTVGKGSHHNFLSDALDRMLAGAEVAVSNGDAPFNNIVYIADLAQFLADWLRAPRSGYAVTNLAAPEPMRVRDVVSLMFRTAGIPERIVAVEDGRRPFSIALGRARALGYRPRNVRASAEAFVRDSIVPGGSARARAVRASAVRASAADKVGQGS